MYFPQLLHQISEYLNVFAVHFKSAPPPHLHKNTKSLFAPTDNQKLHNVIPFPLPMKFLLRSSSRLNEFVLNYFKREKSLGGLDSQVPSKFILRMPNIRLTYLSPPLMMIIWS